MAQGGVWLHLASFPNEFSWHLIFRDRISTLILSHILCWKLDDAFVSVMRSSHLQIGLYVHTIHELITSQKLISGTRQVQWNTHQHPGAPITNMI